MIEYALIGLGIVTWLLAGAAILLGRNLTRSVMIGYAFVGCLCLVLLVAGAGFLAIAVPIISAIGLASIQVFGWMLVDVDRDHLAPTDAPTWVARLLSFILLGAGLAVLVVVISPEISSPHDGMPSMDFSAIGEEFFGRLGGAAVLMGLAIAAALLATMLLLRDEEGGN